MGYAWTTDLTRDNEVDDPADWNTRRSSGYAVAESLYSEGRSPIPATKSGVSDNVEEPMLAEPEGFMSWSIWLRIPISVPGWHDPMASAIHSGSFTRYVVRDDVCSYLRRDSLPFWVVVDPCSPSSVIASCARKKLFSPFFKMYYTDSANMATLRLIV